MSHISNEKLNTLFQLNKTLTGGSDFTDKIAMISDTLKELMDADRCTIYVHDNDNSTFWTAYIDGYSFMEVRDNVGIVSEVYNTQKPIIINDVPNDPRFFKKLAKDVDYEVKSMIAAPLVGFGNRVIGVIQMLNKHDEKGFTEEDLSILEYTLHHIVAFVEMMIKDV